MHQNLDEFFGDVNKSQYLIEQLRKKVFVKTELDITYTDFYNWEKGELLFKSDVKGKWKYFDYSEYVWIKIVQKLRGFGFSYDKILEIKDLMFVEISAKELFRIAQENPNILINRKASGLLDVSAEDYENYTDTVKYFEYFLLTTIVNSLDTSFLFFKDGDLTILPFSSLILEGYDEFNIDYSKYLRHDFVSISLSKIISKFLSKGTEAFDRRTHAILTPEEKRIFYIVRKELSDIKRISIRFDDSEPDIIEVDKVKKVQVESRLMDHITKGEYCSIHMEVVNGKPIHFKKTTKRKL